MQVIGFDPGNSESTLTWKAGAVQRHATIPSFIGSGRLEELKRVRSGAGAGTIDKDELVLEHNGTSHFVGKLAVDESRDASAARNDVGRYWNGHTLRLLLALAAHAGISGPVRIMTGLPVSAWSLESKHQVQRALCGRYTYRVNGKHRHLEVDAVGVMMEGAAALASGVVEDVPQAVIDIGGRTTDLFWSQGVRPITARCSADAIGVERVGDVLRQEVLETHQRDLKPNEIRSILRAHAMHTTPPRLFSSSKELELNGSIAAAVATVGDQIASYVAAQWGG